MNEATPCNKNNHSFRKLIPQKTREEPRSSTSHPRAHGRRALGTMSGVPAFRPATSTILDPYTHIAYSDAKNAMPVATVAGNIADELDPDVLRAHLADTAQREAELRNRQQEQFNKLRARLRSLETESAILSAPVLELRRKQQELLANKRYAEAFEHMKIIKSAEKEVMTTHREEHRHMNEESVRKLLEGQARERESFRKTREDAFAALRGSMTGMKNKAPRDSSSVHAARPNLSHSNANTTNAHQATGHLETQSTWDTWRAPSRDGHAYHHAQGTGIHEMRHDHTRSSVGMSGNEVWVPPSFGENSARFQKHSFPRHGFGRETTPHNNSYHPTHHASTTEMRTIPDTWQATAVNTRPIADGNPNAHGYDRNQTKNDGVATLENASRALLSAALTLVGGGDLRNDRVPFMEHRQQLDPVQVAPPAVRSSTSSVPESVPTAPMEVLGAAANPGVSKTDEKRTMASVTHAHAFLPRSSQLRGDDSDEDDMDDAPLAFNDAQTRTTGEHIVPNIDLSRLELRKANYEKYDKRNVRESAGEPPPAPPSKEKERGIQKFLKTGSKVNALVKMKNSDDARGNDEGDTREDAVDAWRPKSAKNSLSNKQTEVTPATDKKKKTAAAKLLMRKASSANKVVAALTEKSPSPQQAVSEDASSDAAHTERSSLAPSTAARSPVEPAPKPLAKALALPASAPTETNLAAKAQQENRIAEVSKRQFTTEDFRNLFSYSRHGKYKQVTDLLKSGCPAEGRDKFGNSPLVIACQNGNARIVKALLRHGASIDAQNKQGCTGLHYCIAYGFNSLSDYLIAKGANDKLLNKLGLTPYEGIK